MSKTLPPSRTAPQFVVRFPDGDMRDRIKKAADSNGRSMNSEIIHRLALSLDAEDIRSEPAFAPTELPDGAVIDHGTQVWAERLAQPKNRQDLEGLLAIIRAMLGRAGKGENE